MRSIGGLDGLPLFHHFSWVRSYENMLHKVSTWGHKCDKDDWPQKVKEMFDSHVPLDFVHGYKYDVVPDAFGISS
jgi:hypothetical protein